MNFKSSLWLVYVLMMVSATNSNNDHRLHRLDHGEGGGRDKHGCYIMAAYEWCEKQQKCVRWNTCNEKPSDNIGKKRHMNGKLIIG